MKVQLFKIFGIQQRQSPKREIHHNTSLPQKIGSDLKELEREQQIKPKPSRRRELINIRAELNEIKTRRTVEQIDKTRVGSLIELIR